MINKFYGNKLFNLFIEKIGSGGSISHAYLICGEDGLGKTKAAKILAKTIICLEKDKPCFNCINCKKIDNSSHPDFIVVEPDESGSIKIEKVRQMLKTVNIIPNESDKKIYLIKNIEKLSIGGANSLLKTLEQPPNNVIFLLTGVDKRKILKTISSRCVTINLEYVSEDDLIGYLEMSKIGYKKDELVKVLRMSDGNIGKAKYFLTDKSGQRSLKIVNDIECALAEGGVIPLLKAIAPLEDKKEFIVPALKGVSNLLLCAFRERVLGKRDSLLSKYNAQRIIKMNKGIERAILYLDSNANLRLTLTCLVCEMTN